MNEIAHGLLALGFGVGARASILANTVVSWVLADLAVLSVGGVSNGIYPTDAAAQVQYLCADSDTVLLFVEDDEQLDKALAVRDQLPQLARIVVFDMQGLHGLQDPGVIGLDALRSLGRAHLQLHPGAVAARVAAIDAAALAILVYTSGTTGRPKGAMHNHVSLVAAMRGYQQITAQFEGDERMCFLPLCHIAERMGGEYFAMYSGARLNFVENPETVPENVREIAPTVATGLRSPDDSHHDSASPDSQRIPREPPRCCRNRRLPTAVSRPHTSPATKHNTGPRITHISCEVRRGRCPITRRR